MTHQQFNAFVEEHDLYSFDGLIKVTLTDGSSYSAVWITDLPPLGKSVDGRFAGKDEGNGVYYLFDEGKYVVWNVSEIESLACMQQRYLM